MKLFELQQDTPFFNFGTMRDRQILELVLGHAAEDTQDAKLTGYRTARVKGKPYPALIKTDDDSDVVSGLLVGGLSPEDLKRIEYYEEGLYGIKVLSVTIKGKTVKAKVYADYKDLPVLKDNDWNFETFLKEEKPDYIKEVEEWMSGYKES
ncbi:hypothetical protein LCGC14_0763460 [marine sediment metagenome]|uniref:Putative gamma-glutamylcyclotransferase n=1 Tax=marine sediment metagenome TaxID=412755 RepID=A0A0F9T7H1_9ZZZZ